MKKGGNFLENAWKIKAVNIMMLSKPNTPIVCLFSCLD